MHEMTLPVDGAPKQDLVLILILRYLISIIAIYKYNIQYSHALEEANENIILY
jgi:hypothetical protein